MSVSICTNCLSRLRLSNHVSHALPIFSFSPVSAFHSSANQQNVLKKKTVNVPGQRTARIRESRSARIKKKGRERPKPPPIGERKAQRKRIVLSNINALEVPAVEKLDANNSGDLSRIGQFLALDGELLDQLRDAKAFQTTQNWNLFRTPSTLVRQETTELGKEISSITAGNKGKSSSVQTVQRLVTGSRGSGKSIHLLQAMSMAYLNEWVVITVPDCKEFVINQSAYAPVPEVEGQPTQEQMYIQPTLASELLTRLASSNAAVLSKLKPVYNHPAPLKSIKTKTLKDMALLGAEEPTIAPTVWEAVWKELTAPPDAITSNADARPPIMVAIDGLDHWMGPSKYRSADYHIIHAHQFTLIRQFLDLLFNKENKLLPSGGMVIAATTASNSPSYPSFQLLTDQIAALSQGMQETDPNFPMPDPYAEVDDKVFNLLSRAQLIKFTQLNGLTRGESRGLLEFFAKSGIFREPVTDANIGEKWSLSGGGIIGELYKFGKRVRIGDLTTGNNQSSKLRV